ncbi:MAG: hypothetical protein WA571_05410, partial [Candidatus Binatus sp.]
MRIILGVPAPFFFSRSGDPRLKKIRTRKSRPLEDRFWTDMNRIAIHILRVWRVYARSSTLTRVRHTLIVNAMTQEVFSAPVTPKVEAVGLDFGT